jgi:hypothetical protein
MVPPLPDNAYVAVHEGAVAMGRRRLWAAPILLVTAACTSGHHALVHESTSGAPQPRLTPAVASRVLEPQSPIATWQLHGSTFTTGRRTETTLDVGKSISGSAHDEIRQAALVFPRPRLRPSCVTRATLELTVTGGRHLGLAELAVYPSDESNYLGFADVANSGLDLSRLVDNRPRGYAPDVTTGRLRIDVTDLYRTWAAGGPFPGQGRTVNRHWPMGVVVRPPAADDGSYDVLIANGRRAPHLHLVERGDCAVSSG